MPAKMSRPLYGGYHQEAMLIASLPTPGIPAKRIQLRAQTSQPFARHFPKKRRRCTSQRPAAYQVRTNAQSATPRAPMPSSVSDNRSLSRGIDIEDDAGVGRTGTVEDGSATGAVLLW
jgi:hypothetical protein